MVVDAVNSSIQKTARPVSEFRASLAYTVRQFQKKENKQKNPKGFIIFLKEEIK